MTLSAKQPFAPLIGGEFLDSVAQSSARYACVIGLKIGKKRIFIAFAYLAERPAYGRADGRAGGWLCAECHRTVRHG